MSQQIDGSYSSGRKEAPIDRQDSTATGEGVSLVVEDICDDDTQMSDRRCKKQAGRDSFKHKPKHKGKLKKRDITIGTCNVRTILQEVYLTYF